MARTQPVTGLCRLVETKAGGLGDQLTPPTRWPSATTGLDGRTQVLAQGQHVAVDEGHALGGQVVGPLLELRRGWIPWAKLRLKRAESAFIRARPPGLSGGPRLSARPLGAYPASRISRSLMTCLCWAW